MKVSRFVYYCVIFTYRFIKYGLILSFWYWLLYYEIYVLIFVNIHEYFYYYVNPRILEYEQWIELNKLYYAFLRFQLPWEWSYKLHTITLYLFPKNIDYIIFDNLNFTIFELDINDYHVKLLNCPTLKTYNWETLIFKKYLISGISHLRFPITMSPIFPWKEYGPYF